MEGSIVRVISHRAKVPTDGIVVDTTSHSNNWSQGLSPFYLGPVKLYGDYEAKVFENAWQMTKLFPQYAIDGEPAPEYYNWAQAGWSNNKAVRYPMGRDARPLYAIWNGEKLGYVDARKRIYCPLYADCVQKTPAWNTLVETYEQCCLTETPLYLRDFDGYNCYRGDKVLQSYNQVINNPNKKMGHGFVLAMLLDDCREW